MAPRVAGLVGLGLLAMPLPAAAEPAGAAMTDSALESWLAADPAKVETKPLEAELEAPPAPPRRHGLVIEGSIGALGHLGDMKHVSPVSPWFRLQLGYELFDWLLLSGQGDLALSSTEFANSPPDERSYALFGFGVGARVAWQPWSALGFYLQGDAGLSSITEDVLSSYGYRDASDLEPYVGGTLGLEWFQINPHYGLGVYGGVRDYLQNFERTNGAQPPLAWVSGLAIRYTL